MPFDDGTPSVEVAYYRNPSAGLDLRDSVRRVLDQKTRGVRPFLRVDYEPGRTCPTSSSEAASFLDAVGGALDADPAAADIDLSPFNEPNLNAEGGYAADYVAEQFCLFADRFKGHRIWLCATLAHGSDVIERWPVWAQNSTGLEPSPWAAYYVALLDGLRSRGARPHGFLLHAYERPGQPFTPDGWRFGYNVVETWAECLGKFPEYAGRPIVVSEYNARTGGRSTADQYEPGMLSAALSGAASAFGGRAEALCVFVGRSDGVWVDDSIGDPVGRCAQFRDDYVWLKRAGF